MKKLLIFVTLILEIGIQGNAQEEIYLRLGMTLTEIKKELPNSKVDSIDSNKVIVQETKYTVIFYFLNENNICNLQVYKYNITFLSTILKTFNEDKNYVKLNSLEYLYNNGEDVRRYEIQINSEKETVVIYVENM
jgi:predicted nucleotidyltransferase component of viral defense system